MIKEENGKPIGYCKCGFKRTAGIEISASEKNSNKVKGAGVLGEDESVGLNHKCKKCGHDTADFVELGEILNNEASVFLYKCRKCGYTERETGSA
jgi:DNA-directed RNA polymerase subunit M/transcription elongation factor TFIIS